MISVKFIHPLSGDEPIEWDPKVPGELERMREWFKGKLAAGFRAFAFKKGEKLGRLITKFDEEAERIILTSEQIRMTQPLCGG